MRKQIVALAGWVALVGVLMAAGRPGIVRTKDGSAYDGQVEEKEDVVAVTVRGIQTSIPRERIASITYGDFEQRWTADYEKLDEKDAAGRIEIGRRAFDERRYDLAERALKDAIAIDPNNADAAELLRLTLIQKRLEKSPTAGGNTSNGNSGTTGTTGSARSSQYTTLTPEDIQVIKRKELSEGDTRVNIGFKNGVLKKYHDADPNTGMNYTQFQRQPNVVKALMIIRNGGELANDVEVNSDPASLLAFRRDILPLVLTGCATSACHGGNNDSTKVFAMITPASSNAEIYTNYYVLQSYKKNVSEGMVEGLLNPTNALMIDRLNPAQSLLLQYGLAAQNADHKHPTVRGYNGIFSRGREDPKYKTVENWISSLGKIDPRYDIDFTLKRRGDAEATPTAPTTAPAE